MILLSILRRRLALGAALVVPLAVAAVAPRAGAQRNRRPSAERRGKVDTTFAFDRKGTITVITVSGDITVGASQNGNVRVRSSDDEADVRLDASSQRLTLEAFGSRGSETNFELDVPTGVRVIARTQHGAVKIRGTGGPVEIHSQSGDVEVDGVDGGLDVNTFSGDVVASHIVGDFSAHTINGDIKVRDLRGDVEAVSVSGEIDLGGATSTNVQASTTSADITYDGLIDPSGHYQLKSNSGDITLKIQRDASAQLSVSTWSGEIDSGEFPMVLKPGQHGIGVASSKKFTFDIGGGAARITAETFSGDIAISAAGRGSSTRKP